RLVAELGLDLVPDLREVPIRPKFVAGDVGEDLLVRHAEAVVAALAVLEAKHVFAHHGPPPRLLPDLARMERRQEELLRPDRLHLLADDRLDLEQRAPRQRKLRVDAGGELTDEAGPQQKLVRDHLRVGRRFLERGNEGFGESHRGFSCTIGSRFRRSAVIFSTSSKSAPSSSSAAIRRTIWPLRKRRPTLLCP